MLIICPLSFLDNVDLKERRWEMQIARRAAMTEEQRNEVNRKHREARHQKNGGSRPGVVI